MQFPTGRVFIESFLAGDHCRTPISVIEALAKDDTYDFDCSIPRARGESVFGDGAPCYRKRFPLVLVEVHYGKLIDINIVKLYGTIAASDQELIFVDLRPSQVILGIVRVEAELDII